jgi:hypothetical protein
MTKTIHADTRAELWRAIVWCVATTIVFALLLDFYLLHEKRIGGWGALGIILGGVTLGVVTGTLIAVGSGWAAAGLVTTLTAGGGLTPRRSFSFEESLIASGRLTEAREALLAHLAREPRDSAAALALASLHRDQLRDPAGAVRVLLDLRRHPLPEAVEFSVTNQLIDLYRATGDRGRELTELARFADRFKHTTAGAQARLALTRIKSDGA